MLGISYGRTKGDESPPNGGQMKEKSLRQHLKEIGSIRSEKKAASSRENGKKGGRKPGSGKKGTAK